MLKFYYNLAPNPTKVALFLEESGLPYESIPVDTRKGEQHMPAYRQINPNGKVPAIVDGDVKVFDSNAILLYLAEKTGKFLPPDTPRARARAPLVAHVRGKRRGSVLGAGGAFQAPRSRTTSLRDQSLSIRGEAPLRHPRRASLQLRYMLGDTYTIVDMAVWGWARMVPFVLGDDAWAAMPQLKRLLDEITARPAAVRALALKEKHTFKTEMDDESRRSLFPQNYAQVG